MAEYVCEVVTFVINETRLGPGASISTVEDRYEQRERVIRCRDCKHMADPMSCPVAALMKIPDYAFGTPYPPDGFCSWAEPKEDA